MAGAFQGDAFQTDTFEAESGESQDITLPLLGEFDPEDFDPEDFNTSTVALFAPTVALDDDSQSVTVALINQAASPFSPTVTAGAVNVTVAVITQTAATFAPTVTSNASISVGLINQAATTFDPTVTAQGVLALGVINQTASTFNPIVINAQQVAVAVITQTAAAFAPTVISNQEIVLALIDRTAVAHTPGVANPQTITLAQISQTASLFDPTVTRSQPVVLARITQTAATFAPVVIGPRYIVLARITRTAVASTPVVLLASPQSVIVGLINRTAVAHAPVVAYATQAIVLGRITQSASLFTPLVTYNQTVSVGLIDQSSVPYAPHVFTPTVVIGGGGGPGGGTGGGGVIVPGLVVIRIDGVDITEDVQIAQATFISQVNGAVGQAGFYVKDIEQTYQFNSGDSLTLDINDVRVWGGYVMMAKKVQSLITRTDQPAEVTRQWQVMGVDYNILFHKRIVFDASDPDDHIDFSYDATTYDDTIIDDIFTNYLPGISGDGLSNAGVTRIARAILDVPGKTHRGQVASAGFTWKQMMDSVQRATGGIYYISPTKVLTYIDAETVTSSYELTDTPTDLWDIGYQSISILEDGTQMVNDMFVWGAGGGTPNYVFSRATDSASIAEHGRWQMGLLTGGLFRQASADIVADSYVYGTPQSHRGGKDNGRVFTARVFEPFFKAGDIVDLTSNIFDYQEALPLRRMVVSFVNPSKPIFDLMLSHMIDLPVSIAEFLYRTFSISIPNIDIGDGIVLPPPPGGDGECLCGITETFSSPYVLTVNNDFIEVPLPTSDSGIEYATDFGSLEHSGTGSATAETTGGVLHVYGGSDDYLWWQQSLGPVPALQPGSWNIDFQFMIGSASVGPWNYSFSIAGFNGVTTQVRNTLVFDNSDIYLDNVVGGGEQLQDSISNTLSSDVWYNCRIERVDDDVIRAKFWLTSAAEPGTWDITVDISGASKNWSTLFTTGTPAFQMYGEAENDGYIDFSVDNIDLNGDSNCSAVLFDNFNGRSVSSGWGTSTGLYEWEGFSNPTRLSVLDGNGRMILPGGTDTSARVVDAAGPWGLSEYTMTCEFQMSADVASGRVFDVLFNLSNNDIRIQMASVAGPPTTDTSHIIMDGASPTYIDPSFWTSATIYTLTVSFLGGALTATVSGPGGSYQVVGAGTVSDEMIVRGECFGSTAQAFSFNSIDFDYSGRPCGASPCGENMTILDTFTRTSGPRSWGTSDASAVWSSNGNPGATPQASFSVDGSVGHLLVPRPDGLDEEADDTVMVLDNAGPGSSNWSATFRCRFLSQDPSNTEITPYINFQYGSVGVAIETGAIDDPDTGMKLEVFGFGDSASTDIQPFALTTGSWYRFRIDNQFGVYIKVKIWPEVNAEPLSWTVVRYMTGQTSSSDGFSVYVEQGGSSASNLGQDFEIEFDDLSIGDLGLCVEDDREAGLPTSGYVCEEIVGTGVAEYSTTNTFAALSTQVWVNGLRQIRLTHYLETGLSEIGFTSPVAVGDIIRVCYTATGAA